MKKILLVTLFVIVAGVAYYAIAPLFNNIEVVDTLPETFTNSLNEGGEVYAMDGPFEIHDTLGHPAEGTVSYYEGDGKRFLRFDNFKTINGPNLHLYLAKDKDGKEFIDLGPIKGTEGSINYDIPDDIILSEYPFVLHWCVPFGVLFNYAEVL